jgi:hypothetical protein
MYMDRIFSEYDLADWQGYAGIDTHSHEHWQQLSPTELPRSHILYNDTENSQTYNLGTISYLNLDQQPVTCFLTLAPFTSQILVQNVDAPAVCAALDDHIYLPLLRRRP